MVWICKGSHASHITYLLHGLTKLIVSIHISPLPHLLLLPVIGWSQLTLFRPGLCFFSLLLPMIYLIVRTASSLRSKITTLLAGAKVLEIPSFLLGLYTRPTVSVWCFLFCQKQAVRASQSRGTLPFDAGTLPSTTLDSWPS